MEVSIIIPTYNEEAYLPLLLESIRSQDFTDYEIIIADANSTDRTVPIATDCGALIVKGGLPAVGRNNGFRAARGNFLFFFDADVVLPAHFLRHAYEEMQERFLDLATCEIVPLSDLPIDKVLHSLATLSIRMGQYSRPYAPGFCILVTKRLFDRAGGFDETLTMAEDHEFVKRASRFRPLRVLESTAIRVSVRRLEKEGRVALLSKYLQVELYRIFKGEMRTGRVEYEFGKYHEKEDDPLTRKLITFQERLARINANFARFTRRSRTIEDELYRKRLSSFKREFENSKESLKQLFESESKKKK
jgi:glycosyltransferase involved in cell wall biosynthesis